MNGFNSIVRAFLLGTSLAALILGGCNLPNKSHNANGTQAFKSGQINLAVNEFQKALNANPRDPNTLYNLGAVYQQMAKQTQDTRWFQQAEQLYRQAISYNSSHVDAHRGLASMLIETGKEQYAFDLINQWQQRNPMSEEPLIELARLYQAYGDNRRTVDLLTDALKLNSQSTRALTEMGRVRESQGQTQLALNNYVRALQLNPQITEVAQRVAVLQNQLGFSPAPQDPGPSHHQYGAIDPYVRR